MKGEASERCMRPGETTVRDDDVECNGRSVWRWLETGLRLIRSGDSSSRGASDINLVGGTETTLSAAVGTALHSFRIASSL